MYDLKTTQEIFWQLIQEPEGFAEAVSAFARKNPSLLTDVRNLLVERVPGEIEERMEIYSRMYFQRLFECIQEDFPATESVLGKRNFHELVVAYLQKHPSRYSDIALVGKDVASFLSVHPTGQSRVHPYLSDLARLEWGRIEVAREADAPPYGADDLRKIPADHWASLTLKRIPASRLVASRWDILTPWKRRVLENESLQGARFTEKESTYLIWRKAYDIFAWEIDAEEAEWLGCLSEGMVFEELCEKMAEKNSENASRAAAQYLNKWLSAEILVKIG